MYPRLDDTEANRLLGLIAPDNLVTRQLSAREVLFDQEEMDDNLYVLEDGLLEVSVLALNGRRLALNQMRSGTIFGEIAIFDPGPRTARVEALEPSRVTSVRQSRLLYEMQREPKLAALLLKMAGKRMRWMSRQVEDQVFLTPASRLAAKLLYLMGDGRELAMSQAQLADYVGVTREVVSKTLADWRREGIVDVSRGRIIVKESRLLAEIIDPDFF